MERNYSSIFSWEIPWAEESGRLYSPWGFKSVRHNLMTNKKQLIAIHFSLYTLLLCPTSFGIFSLLFSFIFKHFLIPLVIFVFSLFKNVLLNFHFCEICSFLFVLT